MVTRFYVQNFGCRATQADGAAIERQFEDHGLERASALPDAEIVVLNTCTVTSSADQDARAAIRRVHRENPQAQIVVTGCYAQRSPGELAILPGVSQVIGNSHKHLVAQIAVRQSAAPPHPAASYTGSTFVPLRTLTAPSDLISSTIEDQTALPHEASIFISDIFAHTELLAAPVFEAANERTRPNLKVQDGCDNRCSFCVIPYVRGQSRSLKLEQILREVNTLVGAGYRELVISGINLGRWGRDFSHPSTTNDPVRFEHLLRSILAETSIEKIRISSVEPMDWSDELISLVASSHRIAKHAHVPLQSGSDAVLRRMHRKYRPWHYRDKIEKIRAAMPHAAIGADVMVGFPGESDAEFEATRRMIDDLPFTYLHVFTYSARPGTPAADMPHRLPPQVARERNRILRELGEHKKLNFMRSFIGHRVEAITLARSLGADDSAHSIPANRRDAFTEALTDNYLKLRLAGHHEPNRWVTARVDSIQGAALVAMTD